MPFAQLNVAIRIYNICKGRLGSRGGGKGVVQLMAQFRIFPSSESHHSFVANYTSAVKFKIHILVLFCCIIIPLYMSESKYL